MSAFIKLATIIVVLNIFMYLGVNFAMTAEGVGMNEEFYFYFGGDLIQTFMGDDSYSELNTAVANTKDNWTSYNINIDGEAMNLPEQQAGEVTGEGGVSFIDALAVLWAIVPTMGNIVIAPFTLFFNFDMPIFIGLMIGIPYIFLLAISFYALLGGRE